MSTCRVFSNTTVQKHQSLVLSLLHSPTLTSIHDHWKKPFRYDLNQIPYDYTVEVRNRFKGLDLIDRLPDKLWSEVHDIVQKDRDQDHPHGKEMQKNKMSVWGGLTNSCKEKRSKKQRRKGKI